MGRVIAEIGKKVKRGLLGYAVMSASYLAGGYDQTREFDYKDPKTRPNPKIEPLKEDFAQPTATGVKYEIQPYSPEDRVRWQSGLYRALEDMDGEPTPEEKIFSDMREKIDAAKIKIPVYEPGERLRYNGFGVLADVIVTGKYPAKNRSGDTIGTWYDLSTEVDSKWLDTRDFSRQPGARTGFGHIVFNKDATIHDKQEFRPDQYKGQLKRIDLPGQ